MSARRLTIALLTTITVALGLAGCTGASDAASIDAVSKVTYSQTQAVPDFDEGEYVVEGVDLVPLLELMRRYDIDPATYSGGGDACPGSISTTATIEFDDGTDNTFTMEGCEPDTFATEAGVMLLNYSGGAQERENGFGSIDYAQSQAVPGYDMNTWSQGDPAEVAKFVALLHQYGIDPDGYVSQSDPGCTGGVRSNVSLINTSDTEPHVVARLEIDGCGKSDGFDAEATELISAWHAQAVEDSAG